MAETEVPLTNPIDDLRTIPELRMFHREFTAQLERAEHTVEYLTGRVAELEQAIAEKEKQQ